jgi:hypothetical protein
MLAEMKSPPGEDAKKCSHNAQEQQREEIEG